MTPTTSKYKIGLVQINTSFSGQNYLPTSVGTLQVYAEKNMKNPGDYEFLLPIYNRRPVRESADYLSQANAVFFSVYVWNIRLSLEIAKTIKARNPETLIVFGGPQVPDRVDDFINKNRFIDLVCHNEGEQVFLSLLENFEGGAWQTVPGISFVKKDGTLVRNPKSPRLKDLAHCPSPLLEGTFAPLMKAYPEEKWIVTWETNRGCPFSCTFCDWGSSTQSRVFTFDMERIFKELEWFGKNKIEYIFCADANFGILPRDLEIVQYAAEIKKKYGYPQGLSVQNTKNATERAYLCQKILAESGLNKGVTISFQSVDKETLKSIKRSNISTESFQELQRRFTRDKVETYSDLILGLPGETYESFTKGISLLIENGQHNRIQFNNLSILPNAEMGDPEYQKQYGMETVQTDIINIHGQCDAEDSEIAEQQDLVVATNSMPKEDWVKTRAFSWMVALLHFDKVLQIPLVMIQSLCSVSYNELVETFFENGEEFPILSEVKAFFIAKAKDIQKGGPEYCESKEWLNIWWPADEFILIRICVEEKLDSFYGEIEKLLQKFLKDHFLSLPALLLHEAIFLNKNLLKRPFQNSNLDIELSHNIWEYYQAIIRGESIPLENKLSHYYVDRTSKTWQSWEQWFREVIWYGNKKGAYLYGNTPVGREIAGHF